MKTCLLRPLLIVCIAGLSYAPAVVFAQQSQRVYRVGILAADRGFDAVAKHLADLGYVEGRNLLIERRRADNQLERMPSLATDLVKWKLDVIVAVSSASVQAAKQATATIPIVMVGVGNPVASGFVASLAHPGGNITGLSNVSIEISSKYLELLHQAVPKLARVAVLVSPSHPNHPTVLRQIQDAGKILRIAVSAHEVARLEDLPKVLDAVLRERVEGLIVPADPGFPARRHEIVAFANTNRIAAMFGTGSYTDAGGLMSYSPSRAETLQRTAALVDKILRGAKPADLPVELPTRFELAINMKAAKILGVSLPPELLVRADTVIQ